MTYVKHILTLIACLSIISCGNNTLEKKSTPKSARYKFDAPKGWEVERFPFPITFAPQINYTGFEDIRFTPGWALINSNEHWSYAFLWWLDGKINIDTTTLKHHLDNYYYGLLSQNISRKSIPAEKVFRPIATIFKVATKPGDEETYSGNIKMLDYLDLTFGTVMLNCIIHKKNCDTHTAILFEISPKDLNNKVWQELNHLADSFDCLPKQ